jgi:hypothetical protein
MDVNNENISLKKKKKKKISRSLYSSFRIYGWKLTKFGKFDLLSSVLVVRKTCLFTFFWLVCLSFRVFVQAVILQL